jgi:hypothetical protein
LPPPEFEGDPLLAMAVSRPFVERAAQTAWLAGWLCFDSRDHDMDMSSMMGELFPGINLEFALSPRTAPSVMLQPGDGAQVQLVVDALSAAIMIGPEGEEDLVAGATFGAELDANVNLDPGLRAITVRPTDITTTELVIEMAGGGEVLLTEDRLAAFMNTTVLPSFAESLHAIPVTSALFVTAPMAVVLDDLRVSSNHIMADLGMWPVDPDDHTPPVTVVNPVGDLAQSAMELGTASHDDHTPRAFLRHYVTVDGVDEPEPRSGDTLQFSGLSGGSHTLEIAAVDLTGNVDATPAIVTFEVDDVAPEVTVDTDPLAVTETGDVTVIAHARDDRSARSDIHLRYVVGIISRDDRPDETLETGELGRDGSVVLRGLPDGEVVRITVIATDEAGNEGEAQSGIAVLKNPTFGCTAAPAAAPLALLALLLGVRRRARRT